MEIKKLAEHDGLRTEEAVKRQKVSAYQDQNAAGERPAVNGEDRVSISPLSRQLSQISGILDEDEAARALRVAGIKQQVEAGTYSVNSKDVALSLISFAADNEEVTPR